MRRAFLVFGLVLLLAGCGMRTVGTHTVAHDGEWFTEQCGHKTVEFKDWKISVGDRSIDIPHEKTVLVIANGGKNIQITANGKTIYQE